MQKSKFIDFARGFSILTIVLYHFLFYLKLPTLIGYAVQFGGAGVHVFFFCSGFGLYLSNFSTYTDFLYRRLRKILIPYYIAVTLIFSINILFHIYSHGFDAYLSHIFLYKMFVNKYEAAFGIQFWFISTIIQFYLVFPLLLKFVNTYPSKYIFLVCLAISLTYSYLISISPYSNLRVFNGFFLQYLWEFVLGMLISKSGILDKLLNKPLYIYFIIAFFGIIGTGFLAIYGGMTGKNFNDIFSFFGYASITIILYRLSNSFFPALKNVILFVTPFSFSLYLLHMLVWDVSPVHTIYLVPFYFAAAIVVSFAYDILFNRYAKSFIPFKRLNLN